MIAKEILFDLILDINKLSDQTEDTHSWSILSKITRCPPQNALDGIFIEFYINKDREEHLSNCKWLTNCWINVDGLHIMTNYGKGVVLADPNCINKICNTIIEQAKSIKI